jgi:hypothetical protein
MAETLSEIFGYILGGSRNQRHDDAKPRVGIRFGEIDQILHPKLGNRDFFDAWETVKAVHDDVRERVRAGQMPVAIYPAEHKGDAPYVVPLTVGLEASEPMIAALRRSDVVRALPETTILSTYAENGIGIFVNLVDMHTH